MGSISMLAITMALLGGASAIALLSVHSASLLLSKNSEEEQRSAGVLVAVVGSQSNSTGAYVWLFDYGWVSAPIEAVYLDGGTVQWTTTCRGDWTGSLCVVTLPPTARGQVTVLTGGVSTVASV